MNDDATVFGFSPQAPCSCATRKDFHAEPALVQVHDQIHHLPVYPSRSIRGDNMKNPNWAHVQISTSKRGRSGHIHQWCQPVTA
jgi:hypothetical protein